MIMKRPGEYMMIAFFQTMFTFGHRPWKVADPSTDDHMGVGAFNMIPFFILDGQKVFTWDRRVWAAVAIPLWIAVAISVLHIL